MAKKRRKCPYCDKAHPVWWNRAKYRDGWYLTVPDETKANGQRQVCLARGWEGHDEAIQAWHLSEAGERSSTSPNGDQDGESMLVGDLVNLLLENLDPSMSGRRYKRISDKRFKNTKSYLSDFTKHFGNDTVAQMRKGGVARVEKWLAKHVNWQSPSTIRSVISRVKQPFNFGVEQNYILSNPIKGLKRPKDAVRLAIFTEEQAEAILAVADDDFAKMFTFLLLTGCRPSEAYGITARDVRSNGAENDLHIMVHHKNEKHTGEKRRVYLLFSELKAIVREAVAKRPSGPLFTTNRGRAWSEATFNNRLRKIAATDKCKRLGLDRHSTATRSGGKTVRSYEYVPYVCRHTFAFRLLSGFYKDHEGRPIKKNYGEVAIYIGDSAKTVEDVYGKLAKATEMLGEEIG